MGSLNTSIVFVQCHVVCDVDTKMYSQGWICYAYYHDDDKALIECDECYHGYTHAADLITVVVHSIK